MSVRHLASLAVVIAVVVIAACSSKESSTAPAAVQTTTVTLGPALATDAYRPDGLPASWSGFCPVANPSKVTLTAGNAYQVVNQSGQTVNIVILPDRAAVETIAAGATGIKHVEYGAVSQPTFTFRLTVAGCTDGVSGQGLLSVTVNSK